MTIKSYLKLKNKTDMLVLSERVYSKKTNKGKKVKLLKSMSKQIGNIVKLANNLSWDINVLEQNKLDR